MASTTVGEVEPDGRPPRRSRLNADPLVDKVGADERVLIIGAGLTAADLVAALDAQAHRGEIMLISRRGLRARGRSLSACPPEGDFLAPSTRGATALQRRIRAAIHACEACRASELFWPCI
jgi:uncharacterized NAD(P)/FAD-binding protein YdhS